MSKKYNTVIDLINNNEILLHSTNKRSHIIRRELDGINSGKLSLINWPKYKDNISKNNIKVDNGNLSKTNECNLERNALTSFINKYDNVMVLAGAGSSISNRFSKNHNYYNNHSHGAYLYRIGKFIGEALEQINRQCHCKKYYNLFELADFTKFYDLSELNNQKMLVNKNNSEFKTHVALILSNFDLFLSIINNFNYFLCKELINSRNISKKKYKLTVQKIDKLYNDKKKFVKNRQIIRNGLTVYWLAHKINEALNIINKECGYEKYYDLLNIAKKFNFKNTPSNKKLTKSDKKNVFNNFEDLLSEINEFSNFINLSSIFNKKRYINTIKKIHNLIRKYCSLKLNDNYFDHSNFIQKLQLLNPYNKRLKIYSTNYDTLFEQAATKNKCFIIDGFDYSPKRTFNNDALNIDFITKDNDNSSFDTSNINPKENVVEIFQLHGSTNWYQTKRGVYKVNSHIADNKIKNNKGEPCMIFPSSKKYAQSYRDPYFDLFFNFQKDLHKKNTLLIVIGFSFGDMHIRRMVYDAMQSNKSLNMIFVIYGGLKAHKDGNNLIIENDNLKEFLDSGLLHRELFIDGDLNTFTNSLDLKSIHNK